MGHNINEVRVKQKAESTGLSTWAKSLLIGGAIVVTAALATAAVVYVVKKERKKYECCEKCQSILDC